MKNSSGEHGLACQNVASSDLAVKAAMPTSPAGYGQAGRSGGSSPPIPSVRTLGRGASEVPESDWIVVAGTHEPLIPPAMFDRDQELMRGRARNVGPRNARAGGLRSPFLPSGLSAFVGGVSVVPGEGRLDVRRRTLPAIGTLRSANSTCGLVAGAGFEPATFGL